MEEVMTTYSDVSLMIDGAWTKGANGRTIPVINPATEEVIGQVAHAETADLDRALAAADKGFKQWRKVSAYERYKIMRKAADLMRQRLDEIATLMTMEQGKPLYEAKIETNLAADIIDWMAEEGRRTYGRIVPARAENVYQLVMKEPVGPVAAFTPWNFPINQVVRKASAALATGCSIIIKGPEDTPGSCAQLIKAFVDAGRAGRRDPARLRRAVGDQRIPDPPSGHQEGHLHRLDAGRQAARGARRGAHEAGDDGARRPRAGDRVRGCRSRAGGERAGRQQVQERRASLRRPDPLPGAREGVSRVRRALHRLRQEHEGG
jgi:hypothetical protein